LDEVLLEPVHSQLKLHRVDAWIGLAQARVGDVLELHIRRERAPVIVEELKSQCRVGEEIQVGSVERDRVICKQQAAAQFGEGNYS
jgi:hypothetical protein